MSILSLDLGGHKTMEEITEIALQNFRRRLARWVVGHLIGLCTNWRPRKVTRPHKAKIHKDFTDALAHLTGGNPKCPPSLEINLDKKAQ